MASHTPVAATARRGKTPALLSCMNSVAMIAALAAAIARLMTEFNTPGWTKDELAVKANKASSMPAGPFWKPKPTAG